MTKQVAGLYILWQFHNQLFAQPSRVGANCGCRQYPVKMVYGLQRSQMSVLRLIEDC